MKRYIGVAIGLGLLLVVLALTSAGPALAQGAIKPIMAFVVNDRANPVPVTVVAPPPQTTAICTGVLGAAGGVAEFVNIAVRYPQNSFVCSGDVTSIDVSRVVFAPDLPSFFANVATYRVTVADSDNASSPSRILAVLTDGTPDAAVIRPFRVDTMGNGDLIVVKVASSGIAGINVTLGGSLVLVGRPAQ